MRPPPKAAAPAGPSRLDWEPLTYQNMAELSTHTWKFFALWESQAFASQVKDTNKVLLIVERDTQININMLMDPSDAGMPFSVWREDFTLPVGLLLRLRSMAQQWRALYKGLTESEIEGAADA
ncbi:hypothetical protein PSPO01_16674 [Paraphaeosphaeria sporulosa]